MEERTQREISWIKAARKDFEEFPKAVQDEIRDILSYAADGNMRNSPSR
jgi:phage-related protein